MLQRYVPEEAECDGLASTSGSGRRVVVSIKRVRWSERVKRVAGVSGFWGNAAAFKNVYLHRELPVFWREKETNSVRESDGNLSE